MSQSEGSAEATSQSGGSGQKSTTSKGSRRASTASRGSRRFVAAGVCFLVAWQVAALVGVPRRTTVALGAFGFVLHVVFGKAYALVPTYFDRSLAVERAPAVHLPLSVAGVTGLALGPLSGVPRAAATVGTLAWCAGAAVFVGVLALSLRGNLTGGETGTGSANAHRRRVDRAANAAAPFAVGYVGLGSVALLPSLRVGSALPFTVTSAAASHLLVAGGAAVLLFAVGFRLLPRLLGASPPAALVAVVLPAGAVGPALLASGLTGVLPTVAGVPTLRVGAALVAAAVVGFGAAVVALVARADRRRPGVGALVAGACCGVLGVGFGIGFVFGVLTPALAPAHLRLNVLGFLGLTIVGVTYHFYPPAIGSLPGVGVRLARAAAAALTVGLLVEVVGLWVASPPTVAAARLVGVAGALTYAWVILGLFYERR
ncbi:MULTISPECIES: hypothetical protein [Halostella]|uniref:hypothetical protein n=1 Tax=Halostella TaxID=1843185 RepID=UPI00196420AD|nr:MULTISPECIES: hypothetical protein [Halostella]